MKQRPRGRKYRNLTARSGVIYYQRVVGGRRIRLSAKTSDWEEAAAFRDLYEERKGILEGVPIARCPTFADFAPRYLSEATGHLAPSTLEDRTLLLGEDGKLTRFFARRPLDEITRPNLLEWWYAEVERPGRSERTGLNYLSALSGVFGYAEDLGLISDNPVDAVRSTLRRRRRSKRGRRNAERGTSVNPIDDPADLVSFLEASSAAHRARFANGRPIVGRRDGHIADLLQLDAGLRLGEAAALRWRDVVWGEGIEAQGRCLTIQESLARGRHLGSPKSGRDRRVDLSLRLRKALRELRVAKGQPALTERVLGRHFVAANYAARHFTDVGREARISRHTPKDLRDTYASWLLSLGVPLIYVSEQLGHSDVSVTARHYARWTGSNGMPQGLELEPHEVPADLLARVVVPSAGNVSAGLA